MIKYYNMIALAVLAVGNCYFRLTKGYLGLKNDRYILFVSALNLTLLILNITHVD
jgi:hypothetical protein